MKIITAAIALLLCTVVYSQNWIRVEGTSQESYSAEINPQNKNTVWFGHTGEIFISYNGGYGADDTIKTPEISGEAHPVTSIFIHPADTNLVFAGTFLGSFKSTDYGKTWNSYLTHDSIAFNGESITCDPLHPDTIYVGMSVNFTNPNNTFFRSFDRGETWEEINMNGHRFCAINALDDGSILGGNYDAGLLLRSTDQGSSWEGVYATPDTGMFEIPKIAQDPNVPTNAWAVVLSYSGEGGYVIKSEDFGKTWTEVKNMGPAINPWAIDVDLRGRIMVGMFIGGERGAYISTDNGNNWTIYSSGIPDNTEPLVWMVKSNSDSLGIFLCDSRQGAFKLNNTVVSVNGDNSIVSSFNLYQNFPNPFNPVTKIEYSIPGTVIHRSVLVQLSVIDILGREIALLVNEEKEPGSYSISFDASQLTSGVYFYRLTAGDYTETKKMMLMK